MSYEQFCKSLDDEEKSYNKYNRRVWISRFIWIMLIITTVILPTLLPLEYRSNSYPILGTLIFIFILIDIFWLLRRHKHSLRIYQKLLLNLCKAIECIKSYLGSNMMTKSHLEELEKRLENISNILVRTQILEGIVLHKYFGDEIVHLMQNFQRIPLPAIHSKDIKKINQVKLILSQMATYAYDFSSDIRIQDINKQFQEITVETQVPTTIQILTTYIRQRPTLSAISGFVILEVFAYYVGVHTRASTDAIYTVVFGLIPVAFTLLNIFKEKVRREGLEKLEAETQAQVDMDR